MIFYDETTRSFSSPKVRVSPRAGSSPNSNSSSGFWKKLKNPSPLTSAALVGGGALLSHLLVNNIKDKEKRKVVRLALAAGTGALAIKSAYSAIKDKDLDNETNIQ